MVSAYANIHMTYQIEYFHPRVLAEIGSWPVDVLADYAHLAGLLAEHGPDLRLPHSRAFGARPGSRAGSQTGQGTSQWLTSITSP